MEIIFLLQLNANRPPSTRHDR